MSRRVMITLPEPVAQRLDQHAADTGQRASTAAAQLIRDGLQQPPSLDRPRQASRHPPAPQTASWIEPSDHTKQSWRSETWMAILALCARYTVELARLEHAWWQRTSRVETLAALAEWRNQLDQRGQDPREELAFQAHLTELQDTLEHTPATGTNTFNPADPPPDDWLER